MGPMFVDTSAWDAKVVMDNLGLSQVFAFDHHFEQMGFLRRP